MFTTQRANVWFKHRKHDDEMMTVAPRKGRKKEA